MRPPDVLDTRVSLDERPECIGANAEPRVLKPQVEAERPQQQPIYRGAQFAGKRPTIVTKLVLTINRKK